jgi:hypothetical protein
LVVPESGDGRFNSSRKGWRRFLALELFTSPFGSGALVRPLLDDAADHDFRKDCVPKQVSRNVFPASLRVEALPGGQALPNFRCSPSAATFTFSRFFSCTWRDSHSSGWDPGWKSGLTLVIFRLTQR